MNASIKALAGDSITLAINAACDSIAPTWPLDRMIAVNPYWQHIGQSFENTAGALAQIAGSPMTMPLSYYRAHWQAGSILPGHLQQAIAEANSGIDAADAIAGLQQQSKTLTPAPLLCDTLDARRDLIHEPAWCDTITHQIGQFCAAWFDRDQADWRVNQQQDLYTGWRKSMSCDHSVALLMKAPHIPAKARSLAEAPGDQIEQALAQLGIAAGQWQAYLQAVLMRVSGWAAWCAYRRWQARLAGNDDNTLVDLLAIRLAWECLVDDGDRHNDSVHSQWQQAWHRHFASTDKQALKLLQLWQRAHEISYQQPLFAKLANAQTKPQKTAVNLQAAFCIDVRSEVFRRHLEAQSTAIQTLGFAGFFGLPVSYTPAGTSATRPQLPGLLAPAMDISDSSGDAEADKTMVQQRESALKSLFGWQPFKTMPASAFTLVEALGLGYAGKLLKNSLPGSKPMANSNTLGLSKQQACQLRPSLDAATAGGIDGLADIAGKVLRGMNLTEGFAPLVLLIGHGSQNLNNPQRAGLDCGACCGQTGEVNARALAGLLNDKAVREKLAADGLAIPDSTCFVAGLHNTTTDDVELFDSGRFAATHADRLEDIRTQLAAAGSAARQERAAALGLEKLADKPEKLARAIRQRANDWAQTRPEWGLANNAAFIVAPRSRTRGVNLAGRSFLHEYDYRKDAGGSLLEQIMTAPMIVTHWINMQYYASTVDNPRYGSGNKTLHNVVGGRLGVFEGNGGDLRTGLAWQSVHDGKNWRHEPLRLTVVIDAPQAAIDRVIAKHAMVKNLLDNQWLYLARFNNDGIMVYRNGEWQAWQAE